jgi:hypothetical protein
MIYGRGLNMATNLDRFKGDLDRLINQGDLLVYSMIKEIDGQNFLKRVGEQLGAEKTDFLKSLPNFKTTYEAWYSESLAPCDSSFPIESPILSRYMKSRRGENRWITAITLFRITCKVFE